MHYVCLFLCQNNIAYNKSNFFWLDCKYFYSRSTAATLGLQYIHVNSFNITLFVLFLPILNRSDRDSDDIRHIHSGTHTSPSCTEIDAAGHQFLDKMHTEENSISILFHFILWLCTKNVKVMTVMLRRA